MNIADSSPSLLDLEPSRLVFLRDVVKGLQSEDRYLPSQYLYDQAGSELFDRICELDEYYVTRTELAIMRQWIDEMAAQIGPGVALVEYGSGSSVKTELLLGRLPQPVAYVPVDISREHLAVAAKRVAKRLPSIDVLPVCADFTDPYELPLFPREPTHVAVYFPGSTIGNFEPPGAERLLAQIAKVTGPGGGLLIGIDLQKDPAIIEAAYNDRLGVTAEFTLNLLHRINRELDADVDVDAFEHQAVYDQRMGRVEISLSAVASSVATIWTETFEFHRGEKIRTEYSHKYTIQQFDRIVERAGMEIHKVWTDEKRWFALVHCVVKRLPQA